MATSANLVNVDVDEYIHDGSTFINHSFFEAKDDLCNTLSESIINFLKNEGNIPESAEVFVPSQTFITPSWSSAGWFCIFEVAFRAGFEIPSSPLYSGLLQALKVSPCQIMPSVWKLLSAVTRLGRESGINLTVDDLKNVYSIRTKGRGRISLRIRSGQTHLVEKLDTGDDRSWASCFMFIKKSSLGAEGEFIPCKLNSSVPEWEPVDSDESWARIEAFLKIPIEQRTWTAGANVLPFASFAKAEPKPFKMELPASLKGMGPKTRGRGATDLKAKVEAFKSGKLKPVLPVAIKKGKARALDDPALDPKEVPALVETTTVEKESVQEVLRKVFTTPSKKRKIGADIDFSEKDFSSMPSEMGKEFIEFFSTTATPAFADQDLISLAEKGAQSAFLTLEVVSGLGYGLTLLKNKLAAAESKAVAETNLNIALRKALDEAQGALNQEQNKVVQAVADASRAVALLEKRQQECHALQDKVKELEESLSNQEDSTAVYYSTITKIEMMQASESDRKLWDLEAEIASFRTLFPGVPLPGEAEDSGSVDGNAGEGPSEGSKDAGSPE